MILISNEACKKNDSSFVHLTNNINQKSIRIKGGRVGTHLKLIIMLSTGVQLGHTIERCLLSFCH